MSINIKNKLIENKDTMLEIYNSLDFPEDNLLDKVAFALNSGVKIIYYKDTSSASKVIKISKKIQHLCSYFDALFFIHNRADIASIVNSDGLIIDDNDIDIKNAKSFLSDFKLFGINLTSFNYDFTDFDFVIANDKELLLKIQNCDKKIFSKFSKKNKILDIYKDVEG